MCGCSTSHAQSTPAIVSGATFAVEDMTCSHCAGTIRNALEAGMPDTDFAVDLQAHRVTVAGDPAIAEALIRDAGYEPVLLAL
jgi:copper chaperone